MLHFFFEQAALVRITSLWYSISMELRQMLQKHGTLRVYAVVVSILTGVFFLSELIFTIRLGQSGANVYRTAVDYHLGTVAIVGLRVWIYALLPLVFLYAKTAEKWEKQMMNRYVEPVAYGLFMARYVAVLYALTWPLELYRFFRARQWNLTHMGFGRFLELSLGDFFIHYLCPALLVFGIIWLMRHYRRRWWKAAMIVMVVIVFAGQVLYPLIRPGKPLDRPAYRHQIDSLFEKAGVKPVKIYVSTQSQDSHQINAYTMGILGANRIVLWDTLFAELNSREVMVIIAHEIGHYRHGHELLNTVWLMLKWCVVILLVYAWSMRAGGARAMCGLTKRHLSPRRLPVFLLALQILFTLWLPLDRWISRSHEKQADAMVMELIGNSQDAIDTLKKIDNEELELPYYSGLYRFWLQDYPTIKERMAFYETFTPKDRP